MILGIRYIIAIFSVLLISIGSYCQQYSIIEDYNSVFSIYASSIYKNGYLYTCGTVADTNTPYKNLALFSKIDTATGNYVEYKTFSMSPAHINIQEHCFIELPGGRFAAGGGYNLNDRNILLIYDSLGDVVNYSIFDDTTATGFYPKFLFYKDSAVYFLLNRIEASFDINLYVVKFDLNGNLIWRQTYGISSLSEQPGSMLDLDTCILIGSARSTLNHVPSSVEDDSHTWLFTIDTAGVFQDEWLDPDGRTYWPDKMLKLDNNKIVMAGGYRRDYDIFNGIYWRGYVAQFDLNTWSKDWWKEYGNITNITYFHDVDTLLWGYLLTGNDALDTPVIASSAAGWLIKVDMNGDMIWERKYSPMGSLTSNCQLRETKILGNGNFISAGWADDGQYQSWILRTDSFGCLLPDCEYVGIEEEPSFYFNIYPNPAEDFVNVVLEDVNEMNMELYDIMGKKVYSKRIGEGVSYLSLENFSSGVYIYTLGNKRGILRSGKLIVR